MATNRSTAPAAASTLQWEDPPATVRPGSISPDKYRAEADELKAHPGKWAVLAEFKADKGRSPAYRLKKKITDGSLPAFAPAGSFEAQTRTNGVVKVYARYTGKAAASDSPEQS